jgi:ubiquinone/menaquinone biosynthesis C-methylase UbiE
MKHDNPFLDSTLISSELYGSVGRIATRTSSLMAAEIRGSNPHVLACDIAAAFGISPHRILDVGCGRGSSAALLAARFSNSTVTALDISPVMVQAARQRAPVKAVCGDFRQLPFGDETFDIVAAPFCLYHARDPIFVCGEISRCLCGHGLAIFATKSRESYRELDAFLFDHGLEAPNSREISLYETFNSENALTIVSTFFERFRAICEVHRFWFRDSLTFWNYVETVPKYWRGVNEQARQLIHERISTKWPDGGIRATSEILVLGACKRRG